MTTTTPIGYEAMKARMDDLRRAGELSRASAPPPERPHIRDAWEDRVRRRAVARWLRLA